MQVRGGRPARSAGWTASCPDRSQSTCDREHCRGSLVGRRRAPDRGRPPHSRRTLPRHPARPGRRPARARRHPLPGRRRAARDLPGRRGPARRHRLHRAAAGRPPSVGRVAAVRRRDGVLGPAGAGAADDDGAQRDGGDDHPGRRGVPRVPRGPPRGGRPAGRRVRLLHGRAGRAAGRRPVPGPGRGGRVVPRGPAGRRRRPGQPASPRRPGAGGGVRRRRRERRDLPARAVRAPGGRVHRGGCAAHDGGLSRGARVRGAGQRDVRRGGGRAAPGGASHALRHPPAGRPGDAAEGRGPGLHRSRARDAVAVGMGGRGAVLPARRPVLRRQGGRRAGPRRRRRRRRDAAVATR